MGILLINNTALTEQIYVTDIFVVLITTIYFVLLWNDTDAQTAVSLEVIRVIKYSEDP